MTDDSAKRKQGYYAGDTGEAAVYLMQRASKPGSYNLLAPITYVDKDGRWWTIDASPEQPVETDLASIPGFASWLVPKDGSHTPAALIHDTMILGPNEEMRYIPSDGQEVSGAEADRIFRDGMQYLGVALVRRWLMWAAVSTRTLAAPGGHHRVRRVMLAPALLFIVFGLFAVPDIIDVPGNATMPGWMPFIGGKTLAWQMYGIAGTSVWHELGAFLVITFCAGLAYALLWSGGPRWKFGLIAGWSLPILAFPMAIPLMTLALYRGVEVVLAIAQRLGLLRLADTLQRSPRWVRQIANQP